MNNRIILIRMKRVEILSSFFAKQEELSLKINYKRIHIGRRTLKSAIAVILALSAVSLLGTTSASSRMVFALLGAMCAMENTFKQSIEACMSQFVACDNSMGTGMMRA